MSASARVIWADMIIGKTTVLKQLLCEIEELHRLIKDDLESEICERDIPHSNKKTSKIIVNGEET